MHRVQPLPKRLQARYRVWKDTTHAENAAFYRALAEVGQDPRDMVISCCDSRVHVTSIFGANSGELFIHRNVAALVPPYEPDGEPHGTSAAIEYAVRSLEVSNILIVGHSQCGGVQGCYNMCHGEAPELLEKESFVGRWMELLRRGYERLPGGLDEDTRLRLLEKEAVLVSLENLLTFPFVEQAVDAKRLSIHGLWIDIADGHLEGYDPATGQFLPL